MEYNNIFKESDFDYRMEKLFKFIEKYGIDHNSKIPMWEDEADPELAKYIYYDMQNVDIPICCKHYLTCINLLFSDNNTRNAQINLIKQKWGTVEGEYHICKNCGEPIEYIKYSEFEGFGRDNKIINVREAVKDDIDEDDIDISESASQTIANIIATFQNLLGITFRQRDYNFITDEVFKIRKEIDNAALFYNRLKSGEIKQDLFTKLIDSTFSQLERKSKKKKITREQFQEKFNRIESGLKKHTL